MTPTLRTAALVLLVLLVPSPALAAGDWRWPVTGEVLTSYRNGADPYAAGQHRGIDIAAPEGAAVVSATPGEVLFAGAVGSSGQTVSVRTADGRFDLSYLHLSAIDVRVGEEVGAGTRLGAVGRTGQRSVDAPHLHFGVRDARTEHAYHDPLDFLAPLPGAPAAPAAPEPAAQAPARIGVEHAPVGPLAEAVAPAEPESVSRFESAPSGAAPVLAAPPVRLSAPAVASPARAVARARGGERSAAPSSRVARARGAGTPSEPAAPSRRESHTRPAPTRLGAAPGARRRPTAAPSWASRAARPPGPVDDSDRSRRSHRPGEPLGRCPDRVVGGLPRRRPPRRPRPPLGRPRSRRPTRIEALRPGIRVGGGQPSGRSRRGPHRGVGRSSRGQGRH